MTRQVFIGIDTSNYTTSAAGITPDGEVFCAKRPLLVPAGSRGMRQSDALFCHTRDLKFVLGELFSKLREGVDRVEVKGVAASETPRPAEGSYMPCFLAGVSAACAMAEGLGVPYLGFSHQEGHIEAARLGSEKAFGRILPEGPFLAFHLSGGTTELLRVTSEGIRYRVTIVAEALDLTVGQLIDRCGVKLGLPFPAGAPLEALAKKSSKKFSVKIPVKEGGINLSGFENRFDKYLADGESPEDCAKFIFTVAVEAVKALLDLGGEALPVIFSGGVSSSEILKEAFGQERYFFAPPAYSADNAMGVAALCRKGVWNG